MFEYYITPEEYEIASRNGVNETTLNKRIRELCWDKQKAINTPPIKCDKNKTFWGDIAVKNGINRQVYLNRINNQGWTYEKAATTPIIKKGYTYRKYSEEILEQAKNTIGIKNFYNRIRKGWSVERALNEPLYTVKDKIDKMNKNNSRSEFAIVNNAFWKLTNRKI